MTTKDKALKLALEAICGSGDFLFNWHDCEPNNEREVQSYQATLAANEKAFIAIRSALAEQPAQQEPVARVINKSIMWRPCDISGLPVGTPLYTSLPASKPWVGLTDGEMRDLEKQFNAERVRTSDEEYLIIYPGDYWTWQRAIEAKLREKNAP